MVRSPELMNREDTALLVIDVQEKLLPWIWNRHMVVWNIRRLLDGAKILGIPAVGTEQYPQGLGPTAPELANRLGPLPSKLAFSAAVCEEIFSSLRAQNRHKILVAGIEAHVCVQQTVLDLLADGWQVYVAADAVGSRYELDYRIALERMDSSGAVLTTTEAALFEWCQQAGVPEFKQISQLAKEQPPSASGLGIARQ